MRLTIAIRGEVADDAEAQQILDFINTAIAAHPEKDLSATCQTTQELPLPPP